MEESIDIFDVPVVEATENVGQPQAAQTNVTTDQYGNSMVKRSIFEPCIPAIDAKHTEQILFDNGDGNQQLIEFKIPERPKQAHVQATWDILDRMENRAWSNKSMGIKTGFDSFDRAFDGGWKSGFYVIAGDSNLGKSAMLTQINWKIIENNQKVYVMEFSLDDAMPDKIARMVASWNKVMINAVKTPMQYQDLPLMLLRRKEGMNKLRDNAYKYRPYDGEFSSFIEDIEEEVQSMKIILERIDPEIQLVVSIDSFHDLNIKSKQNLTETQKYNEIAQWAADLAIKYDLILFATAELKKIEGIRRPILGDLRESIKIRYEAKAILMVYNEVHYKGDNSDIFFMKKNCTQKQPVFEVHIAKNKIHSYKGRFFYYFYPELAYMEEANDSMSKQFANLIS